MMRYLACTVILAFGACGVTSAATAGDEESLALFDCGQVTWMQNCDAANKAYNKNPDTHLRVHDLDGLEFNFAPGTPTVMMRLMMERTPEAAKDAADYLEKHLLVATASSTLWAREIANRGGALKGTKTLEQTEAEQAMPVINYDNIKVYYFYDSNCPFCKKMMPHASTLRLNHAKLKFSAIQLNDDKSALDQINLQYYLDAAILPASKREEYRKKVPTTPSVWVENSKTQKMYKITGYRPYPELSKQLAELSK
jgi:thiol-disulfide isomerase/thioredoxin